MAWARLAIGLLCCSVLAGCSGEDSGTASSGGFAGSGGGATGGVPSSGGAQTGGTTSGGGTAGASAGAGGSAGIGGTGAGGQGGSGGAPPGPCAAIQPVQDPLKNRQTIQGCLDDTGAATLAEGTFDLDKGLIVEKGAKLASAGASKPTLRLVATDTNYLIRLGTDGRVENLSLNANHKLPAQANEAIVHVTGNGAVLKNSQLFNPSTSLKGHRNTGIYFICGDCSGSVAEGNEIFNTFYGVIFVAGLTKSEKNTLTGNTIRDIKCDSVTIAGFGRVEKNTIYDTGWDCENGPIPGGGIYCLGNAAGGEVVGNTIKNQCGMNIDMDDCANVVIQDNQLELPGYDFGGKAPWCVGAPSLGLVDVTQFTLQGNHVTNVGRASNRLGLSGDPNNLLRPSGGAPYSDLPAGANTAVAFLLAQRPNTGFKTTGSSITDNVFIGNCPSPCVGTGFFASRNTGFGAGGVWSAGSTNYFTKNNVNGSQVGSKRCGGNWYAANATCTGGTGDDPSCNNDDYQHNAPVGDWARNDNCSKY